MLFPYKYVPHQMEKMQEYIDFIFYHVWCKAPAYGPFNFELLNGNAELKGLMTAFSNDDSKGAYFFNSYVELIYAHFQTLNPAQIDQFQKWYQANNDIENVCANAPNAQLVRYGDIRALHLELGEQLAAFFKGLYDQQLLNLREIRQKIGDIDDHYHNFMLVNNVSGRCPFCGIGDLKGVHHTKREAYDHYLPKALYPFNSINFHNLAPACHDCNSTYKHSKDPVHNPAGRRKAFYPYSNTSTNIEVIINLSKPEIDNLAPNDIQLAFGPASLNEEIETWKEIYGIEERYRGKLLDGDGKAWLVEVLDEWKWKDEISGQEGRPPSVYLRQLNRSTLNSPFTGDNFLKKAFLEGCQRRGIFNEIVL